MVVVSSDANPTVGPPIHTPPPAGAVTDAVSTPQPTDSTELTTHNSQLTTHPVSTDHAEAIERVRELVDQLQQLVGVIGQVRDRFALVAAEQQPDHPAGIQALWTEAGAPFAAYLNQPIQFGPGEPPMALEEARGQLSHWVTMARDNAVGPGGTALFDDPGRLDKFEGRLLALEPSVADLLRRGQQLLARGDLDLEHLRAIAEQHHEEAAKIQARQAALTAATNHLTKTWGARLASLRARRSQLRDRLEAFRRQPGHSTNLERRVEQLERQLASLDFARLEQALAGLLDWAKRIGAEQDLTAEAAEARARQELGAGVAATERTLDELARAGDLARLAAEETAARTTSQTAIDRALTNQVEAIKGRYRALVDLRRRKLGSKPDERFFGPVAKAVNDAIAQLDELVSRLVELRAELRGSEAIDEAAWRQRLAPIERQAKELLTQTDQYTDPGRLEQRLAAAWQERLQPLRGQLERAEPVHQAMTAAIKNLATEPAGGDLASQARALDAALRQAIEGGQRLLAAATDQSATTDDTSDRSRAERSIATAADTVQRFLGDLPGKLAAANEEQTERDHREQAAEAARAERARSGLPARIAALQTVTENLAQEFRQGLGYATQVEAFDPAAAHQLYERLEAATSVAITVGETPTTLGRLLGDRSLLDALAEATSDPDRPLEPTELAVVQLETILGSAGRAGALLAEVSQARQAQPIATYKRRHERLAALEQQAEQAGQRLAAVTALLGQSELEVRTLSLAEAERLAETLRADRAKLAEVTTALHRLTDQLQAVRHDPAALDDARLGELEAGLRSLDLDLRTAEAHIPVSTAATPSQSPEPAGAEARAAAQVVRQRLQTLLRPPGTRRTKYEVRDTGQTRGASHPPSPAATEQRSEVRGSTNIEPSSKPVTIRHIEE